MRDESGMTLLIVLLGILLVSVAAMTIARVATDEINIAANQRSAATAFYAADGSAEAALHELLETGRSLNRFPSDAELSGITEPSIPGIDLVDFQVATDGAQSIGPLTLGFYQGLNAYTQPYAVEATAEAAEWPWGRATVRMSSDFNIVPIFQFLVFYEEDLEILPGPDMLMNGRVHTNAGLYVDTHNDLEFDSNVTVAGDVFNERKDDGSTLGGTVWIRNADGDLVAMDPLDSGDPDWASEAIERWDGNMRSGVHGVEGLELTIEDPDEPHTLVEPPEPDDTSGDENAKLYYDAGLRILNGVATDADGNVVSLVDPVTGTSALEYTVLRDHREDQEMLTVQLDMEKLGRTPAYPGNGIVYVGAHEPGDEIPAWAGGWIDPDGGVPPWDGYPEPWLDSSTDFAVKLTGGEELASALSVVTENAVYIHGDYNTVDKKPAAVMADAVTVLSNAWGDLDGDGDFDEDLAYSELDLGDREANDTTVNAALMLGNTDSVPGVSYNGGLENVTRFLEDWSGRTFTYRGSLIDLWNSIYADGEWVYGNPVYTAPNRDWAFDTDFLDIANMPPGTPQVYELRVTGWNRE